MRLMKRAPLGVLVLFALFSMSCQDPHAPSDYGTIRIDLSGAGRAVVGGVEADGLRYEIELTGPDAIIQRFIEPGQRSSFSLVVSAGNWTITVRAFTPEPRLLRGTGAAQVQVRNGGTSDAAIVMRAVVDALDLTALVRAPEFMMKPETWTINAIQYSGTVEWQDGESQALGANDLFESDRDYQAILTLTAAFGHTFTGVSADSFTHAAASVRNFANSGTVTLTFPVIIPGAIVIVLPDGSIGGLPETITLFKNPVNGITESPLTIAPPETGVYSAINWYLNGTAIAANADFTLRAVDCNLGKNILLAEVVKDGAPYTREIIVTVNP